MASDMKPCPFCGENMTMKQSIDSFQSGLVRWINCENCFAHSPMCTLDDLSDDEYEAWNTRPLEDALRAENEKLKEALQKIKNWCCVDPDGGVETTISEMVEQALKEVTK